MLVVFLVGLVLRLRSLGVPEAGTSSVGVELPGMDELDWRDVAALQAEHPALVLELLTEGDAEGFRRAIEAGFDVNVAADVGGSHRTPAHHAAAADDVDALRLLVQAGADLSATDAEYQATPLGWARFFEQARAAEYLEGLGAPE